MRPMAMEILHRLTHEAVLYDRPPGEFGMPDVESGVQNSDLDTCPAESAGWNLAQGEAWCDT